MSEKPLVIMTSETAPTESTLSTILNKGERRGRKVKDLPSVIDRGEGCGAWLLG